MLLSLITDSYRVRFRDPIFLFLILLFIHRIFPFRARDAIGADKLLDWLHRPKLPVIRDWTSYVRHGANP